MSYLFQKPGYISIGDPYIKKDKKKKKKEHLKQIVTGPSKKGRVGQGVLFNTYKYESENDPKLKKKDKKKKKKETILTPFKFSSPPQKSTGLGSYYGAFNKYEHMQEYNVQKKGDKPKKKKPALKGMLTNPPKKGGYGTIGTTISPIIYSNKVTIKGKTITDVYDSKRIQEREERKKMKEKLHQVPAFKSTSRTRPFFDSQGNVDASRVFSATDLPKPKKEKKKKEEKKITVAWRPSNPKKAAINPYPKYISEKSIKDTKKKKKSKKNQELANRPVWKTTSFNKSGPSSSVIFRSTK